ncbi:unnamed protein product [Cylindrotheca closterium]|uniref:Uncharacterized protein n=1 Tax=Cylindrotheca closterium TaxID=2856 RepID=A0AAD2GBI6_9STRA|nr:unnamed protein product [Cylindrotheca closterium]
MMGSYIEGPSEQWLTQFPTILIVTSSMVIDRSLRKDLIEERVRCQIWLWFCVILSLRSHPSSLHDKDIQQHGKKEDLIFETWMHLVIVSNLVSIGVLAISGPLERIKKSYNRSSWWFSFAAWTAMMSSSCLFSSLRYAEGAQESIAMFSLQVYILSLCILWIIHWYKRRKEKLEQEMRKITNYGGSGSNTNPSSSFIISQDKDGFDRSKWYTWKPSTTLRWISQVLESSFDHDDVDHGVLQQLASHRIDGPLLDTLSVSQLLQLQVPYGPACHLDQAIQTELVRPFPKPRGSEANMSGSSCNGASFGGTTSAHPNDFLSGFDEEYNSDRRRSFASTAKSDGTSGLADRNSFASGAEMLNLDPNQENHINDVMKERYGLELPRLRTEGTSASDPASGAPPSQASAVSDGEDPLQRGPIQKQLQSAALPTPKIAPAPAAPAIHTPSSAQASSVGGKSEIPEAILKQMPANIQDIAKRRPDLVRQMLLSKQLQVQDQKFQREDQLYTHAEEGAHDGNEDYGNDDEDSTDETSRLLRRRKDHRQYKSTGL